MDDSYQILIWLTFSDIYVIFITIKTFSDEMLIQISYIDLF